MDRAQRKSERLAEKRRRAGRRSHDMSVGEALDADTHEVNATNLAEARAMDIARKAAVRREKQTPRVKTKHGKKKHSRNNKSIYACPWGSRPPPRITNVTCIPF